MLVRSSLRGPLLVMRGPKYVRTLHRGILMVVLGLLAGILVQLISMGYSLSIAGGAMIAGMNAAMNGGGGAAPPPVTTVPVVFQVVMVIIGAGVGFLSLWGWWLFTTRDPGDTTADNAPTARRLVRGAVIANAVFQSIAVVTVISSPQAATGAPPTGVGFFIFMAFAGLSSLGATAAFAVQFFAGMVYIRGLAPRLPSEKIRKMSRSRMIACPIWALAWIPLSIGAVAIGAGVMGAGVGVGAKANPLPIIIGFGVAVVIPIVCFLIALVLYGGLLNRVRLALRAVLFEQRGTGVEPS
jgi:hypothetical protein